MSFIIMHNNGVHFWARHGGWTSIQANAKTFFSRTDACAEIVRRELQATVVEFNV